MTVVILLQEALHFWSVLLLSSSISSSGEGRQKLVPQAVNQRTNRCYTQTLPATFQPRPREKGRSHRLRPFILHWAVLAWRGADSHEVTLTDSLLFFWTLCLLEVLQSLPWILGFLWRYFCGYMIINLRVIWKDEDLDCLFIPIAEPFYHLDFHI